MSLITSRLAKSLKAKCVRAPQHISGFAGELTSNDTVHLTLGTSFGGGGETVTIIAQVVDCITPDYPLQDLIAIKDLPFLRDLPLADPDFRRVELLLGIVDSNKCTLDGSVSSPDHSIRAWNTLFGWAIGGETEGSSTTNICMKVTAADGLNDEILQKFWLVDAPNLETEGRQSVEHFLDTTYRGKDGRLYIVQLPTKKSPPALGESRSLALKWYIQNEKSLWAKNWWEDFSQAVQE